MFWGSDLDLQYLKSFANIVILLIRCYFSERLKVAKLLTNKQMGKNMCKKDGVKTLPWRKVLARK